MELISTIYYMVLPQAVRAEGVLPPGTSTGAPLQNPYHLAAWIDSVQKFLLGLGGFVAMAVIIYAGVLFITAAGNPEKLTSAKKALLAGIIGIVIILMAETAILIFARFLRGG